MQIKRVYLCIAATLVLALSGRAAMAGAPSASARAVAALRQQWCDDLKLKKIDESMRLYADDAVFFNPGGDHVDGKAAIRGLYTTITQTYDSDIHLLSRSTEISGRLAYDSGDFQETLRTRATGANVNSAGSYLMVLRRGRNGRWRIVQQMWAGSPPHP